MGLFSLPKCPHCGGKITPTGYSFPYPQYRCKNCIKINTEKQALENRIKSLEESINKLKDNADKK